MATDSNGGSAGDRSWRGQTGQAAEPPRHRWQMTAEELRETAAAAEDEPRRVRFALLLLAGLGLLGLALYWILLSPARTPMLLVTESVYPPSFPPNAFAEEDADRLEWLDEKNLSIYREGSLANLEQALSRIESEVFRHRTLMIYISAHGAVNSAGEPCLIPAGASPLDSNDWLPLRRVLEMIAGRSFSQTAEIVLFLDCQKVLFEPRMGILQNQFAEAVAAMPMADGPLPRLSIVSSTGSNEVSQTFVRRRQTIFAETVFQALAGRADRRDEGGNADGAVSLAECDRFVRTHVAAESRRARDRSQHPALTTPTAATGSRSPKLSLALRDEPPTPTEYEPGPSAQWRESLSALWRQFERVSPQKYLETHPDETARLQQLLLRLESWTTAGRAYEPHAISLGTLLREHLQQLESRGQNAETFLDAGQLNLMPEDVPQLALSQSLSGENDESLRELEATLQTCLREANRISFDAAHQQWIGSARVPLSPRFHGLELVRREGSDALWQNQSAVRELLEAEQAARRIPALKHLRTFPLRTEEIAAADASRRTAFDLIPSDEPEALPMLSDQAATAIDQYALATQQLDELRAAFQLCHRIDAQVPWLWELLVGTADADVLSEPLATILSADVLRELQRRSKELRVELETGTIDAERLSELETRVETLERELEKFFESVRNPEDMTLGNVRLISRCLASPLISAELRPRLWKARSTLQTEIDARPQIGSAPRVDAETDTSSDQSERLELLQSVAEALRAGEPQHSAEQESLTVNQLQAQFRVELQHRYQLAAQLNNPESPEYAALLSEIDRHELGARQVAAWNLADRHAGAQTRVTGRTLLEVPSVARVFWRVRMQQLLWLEAKRATSDLWGMRSIAGTPYAQAVCDQLLTTATDVLPSHPAADPQTAALRGELFSRLDLVQNRIRVQSDDTLIMDPELPAAARLTLELAAPDEVPEFTWPTGQVAVSLENSSGECSVKSTLVDWGTLPAFGAQHSIPAELRFPSSSYFATERSLQARFYWRGHDLRFPLPFIAVDGGRTESTLAAPQPTTLNVLAEVPPPTDLLFVLDVSQSMREPTLDQSGRTRWEVALDVLAQALQPLQGQSHLRIGVLAYGHRAGWNPEQADELLYQPRLKDSTPPGLLPLEDVEVLLSPGPLTPQAVDELRGRLESLIPWGETPLYLAIHEAAKLVPAESATQTQIIVLTDGVNRQRAPRDLILTPRQQEKLISAEQLESSLAGRPIRLNVLGFDLSAEQDVELQVELRNLVNTAGGDYFPAVDASNLLPLLQEIVGPRSYSVTRNFGLLGNYSLGEVADVESSADQRRPLDIVVRSATARITDDERRAVQLYYRPDRSELTAKPFRLDLQQSLPVPAAAGAPVSGLWLGVHHPRFTSAERHSVGFRFSLQTDSNQFVSRPETFLVRAVATGADGQPVGREWFYFEPQLRADFEVPLWQLQAHNWPSAATHIVFEVYLSWSTAAFEHETWTITNLGTQLAMRESSQRQYFARTDAAVPRTLFLAERRSADEQRWPGFFRLRSADESTAWTSRDVFELAHGVHVQAFSPLGEDADLGTEWNVEVVIPDPAAVLNEQRLTTEPIPVLSNGEFVRPLP